MALIRRETPSFKRADGETPEAIASALNRLSQQLSERLAAVEGLGRSAVLDDIIFETGGSLAVGTSPFPLRVQTPFSIAGAWVVLAECLSHGESGVSTSGVSAWVRPVSGAPDGSGNAMEIQFVSGLTTSRKYRLRLGVVGVKNG